MKNHAKNYVHKQYITKAFSAKRKRGLSTIVSSVILLSAVSIMGVMLVDWANTNLYTKQAELEFSFNAKMNKLNEDLLIENIWFGTSPNVVNMTLNNIGSVGLNVTKIQIKNSTSTLFFTITDGGMAPHKDYSIQKTYNWNFGEITDFSIFTDRGNIFTFQKVT